jgi:hypothetical protein
MQPDIARWKELAHRAIDDTCSRVTGIRAYPGEPLTPHDLEEFLTLDKKLGEEQGLPDGLSSAVKAVVLELERRARA